MLRRVRNIDKHICAPPTTHSHNNHRRRLSRVVEPQGGGVERRPGECGEGGVHRSGSAVLCLNACLVSSLCPLPLCSLYQPMRTHRQALQSPMQLPWTFRCAFVLSATANMYMIAIHTFYPFLFFHVMHFLITIIFSSNSQLVHFSALIIFRIKTNLIFNVVLSYNINSSNVQIHCLEHEKNILPT